ncbi:hypothetical protein COY28_02135 [Candidatus Woesearchaeota archaeon CG_4_10_14_0_2_um_filter_57_5]|nr:MAG: hypothetical protein COY28_02135 [Candidatus Woesearchaeota archaeon CG_4_10_14_0_2_um_filter_57_5]
MLMDAQVNEVSDRDAGSLAEPGSDEGTLVFFVSGNTHKAAELSAALRMRVELLPPPVEVQGTLADIATAKVLYGAALLGLHVKNDNVAGGAGTGPHGKASAMLASSSGNMTLSPAEERIIVADDTALCLDALGGMPGPYIRHFLAAIGNDGLARIAASLGDTGAEGITCIAARMPDGAIEVFEGRARGSLVPPRPAQDRREGKSAMGWDPIFLPDGQERTFSEMSVGEKNQLSPRGKAVAKLIAWLDALI